MYHTHGVGICECPACRALCRLETLVRGGCDQPGFLDLATQRLRYCEGEIRDLFAATFRAKDLPAPSDPVDEGEGSKTQLPKAREEDTLPKSEKEDSKEPIKEEKQDPKSAGGAEAEESEKKGNEEKQKEEGKKKKRKSEKVPKKKKRGKAESEAAEDKAEKKLRRESPSPKPEERGKEKKSRFELKENRAEPDSSGPPPEPARSPIRRREPSSSHKEGSVQGSGWQGRVPVSDHPRWRGKNKGVVKRAKQERYNRSRDWRR